MSDSLSNPQSAWQPPSGIKAICFDAGDTLVFDHPTRYERIASALARCGVSAPNAMLAPALRAIDSYAIKRYVSAEDSDTFGFLLGCAEVALRHLGVDADAAAAGRIAEVYLSIGSIRVLDPSAIGLLKSLRERGFQIGVISDWQPDLPDVFASLGCGGLVDAFSISSVVGATKPSPALFSDCLKQLGVAPSEAIHVGDFYELDALGAQAVGMRTILLDIKGLYRDTPLDVPVVGTFTELVLMLNRLPVP